MSFDLSSHTSSLALGLSVVLASIYVVRTIRYRATSYLPVPSKSDSSFLRFPNVHHGHRPFLFRFVFSRLLVIHARYRTKEMNTPVSLEICYANAVVTTLVTQNLLGCRLRCSAFGFFLWLFELRIPYLSRVLVDLDPKL